MIAGSHLIGASEERSSRTPRNYVKRECVYRRGRIEATIGIVVAVLLLTLTDNMPVWASYLTVWSPLILAVVVATHRRRSASRGGPYIAFRITWMDIVVGAFVGLLLRTVIIIVELYTVGHLTSSSSLFEYDHDLIWLSSAIIAPAILAPVIEELFFRGLLLPAIGINWLGIVGSAAIFSAFHLFSGFNTLTAASTFLAGLLFGLLAVRTKRLGASITAHVVYNASLIAMSELSGLG